MLKPELVAPAGNYEKLKIAIQYGADAIYLGDSRFSLRATADNFDIKQLKQAIDYAHQRGKKVYNTINIFARDNDLDQLKDYIAILVDLKIDAVVVSDPGVFLLVKEIAPAMRIHLSTQANTVNSKSVKFWEQLGISRIILARELTFEEIYRIRESTSIELEVFIHGAICMSYSGRCMLSNYLTGRDANQGKCAHPCRYKFNLLEEKRPGQYFLIEEDEKGTYILSAKDLCTIEHIHKFLKIGINGYKIEGRMKGIYYLAIVTKTYKQAINAYLENPEYYKFKNEWKEELLNISHREYTPGFYFEKDKFNLQTACSYIQKYDLVGIVLEKKVNNNFVVEVRNKLQKGDNIEVFTTNINLPAQIIKKISDLNGNTIDIAQPNQFIILELSGLIEEGSLIRRKISETSNE